MMLSGRVRKKGGMNTLEAMIATITVIGFIAFIMPGVQTSPQTTPIKNHVFASLANLEKTGKLGELATAGNLTGIYAELNRTILLPLRFTVGLSSLSASSGTLYPRELQAGYLNFTANTSTLDSATLELNYINASNPAVYVNGMEAAHHSGNYSGTSETLDIKQHITTGLNSVAINTTNNATINYRLRIADSMELEQRPGNRTISTVSYVTAGGRSGFRPSEIRVYIWRVSG